MFFRTSSNIGMDRDILIRFLGYRMSKSPITVQQWIDALPQPTLQRMTSLQSSSPAPVATSTPKPLRLIRDQSLQSDDASSHCSSVESMLESRRPDPEAVLLGLGFGPPSNGSNNVSRIPERFLKPSQLLKDFDFNKFLEQHNGAQRYDQMYSSLPPSPAHQRPRTC